MHILSRLMITLLLAGLPLMAAADGRRAVVFDIDGTLTPNVYAISFARSGAAEAVRAYADAGVAVIYLTARIPMFQDGVADWLVENGFPAGQLHLTETAADEDDHAAFKRRVLEGYRAQGWAFVAAFGDSSSDFKAYADVGIAKADVFALRRVGAWDCKSGPWQACYEDWPDLMPAIADTLAD